MKVVDQKALVLRLKNPAPVLAAVPGAVSVDENTVAVRWGVPQTHALRSLGFNAPSPIEQKYKWPGKYRPMSHQRETAAFFTLHRRGFCFSEPGVGKTASAIWAADYLMSAKQIRRVLVVCPVSIMDAAWRQDLFTFAMHRRVDVAYGSAAKRRKVLESDAEFVVINYEGVTILKDDIIRAGFDLIIVDECFVAGTPVHTPTGLRPIEDLAVGDMVLTSHGVAPIKTVTRSAPSALVEVHISNGSRLTCTPEHPFFTDWGWVPARALCGRRLIGVSEVSNMFGIVHGADADVAVPSEAGHPNRDGLFAILQSEAVALDAPGASSGPASDSRAASTVACHAARGSEVYRNPCEDIADRPSERAQAAGSWGERGGYDWPGVTAGRGAPVGMDMELPGSVGSEAARLSYQLQARLRVAAAQSGSGGRRKLAPNGAGAGSGREEARQAGGAWVDRVVYLEPRDGELVYNLEVDGAPNYFVGAGHLVHNCSAYQNAQTKRWKALNSLLKDDTWLWMMTGTPAAQGPDMAYGLAKLVNPKGVPRFFNSFRDMVMYKITNFKWGVKPDAADTVHRVLQPAIRHTKAECLDLPDMVYVKRRVEMTAQQKRFYTQMRKQLLLQIAGEQVTAGTAAVAMTKLLQISSGSAYTDDKNVLQFDISTRYSVLMEVLAETQRKVLVFVPFKNTIELLNQKLTADGIPCAVVDGAVPVHMRTKIFNEFQTTNTPRVLVIQPQAAAHGVTLTAADTVVWWGPTASLEIYEQANARAHRKGQTHKCTVVQLVGSFMEQHVYDLLDSKVDLHRKVIELYETELDPKNKNV